MRHGTQRIKTFVGELKAFARPDAGTAAITHAVAPVLEGALALVGPQVRKRQPRIETRIEGAPKLHGVPARLEQILVNLLLNAAEFVPSPGGRIVASARALSDRVELSVTDNGPGVPEELRTRVFDPFFSTRHGAGGTGLGLAITRRIVSEQGGEIRCVEAEGGGARFEVRFPAASATLGRPRPRSRRTPSRPDPRGVSWLNLSQPAPNRRLAKGL